MWSYHLDNIFFRLKKERKEKERALKEGYMEATDGTMVKQEEKPKPSWSRYTKRIIRRIKIEKVCPLSTKLITHKTRLIYYYVTANKGWGGVFFWFGFFF